ncbi:hypothetical protein FSP39_020642 [Pinctada imbricata]|uniref:Angiotensin-converting enzyme n=1 Tax=Pinctada imbricata TaxID=66713 RepID=A0AA88YVC4_PINIB|nr:hypothetical protein FSP39_020642 [Pinctada imbricata]
MEIAICFTVLLFVCANGQVLSTNENEAVQFLSKYDATVANMWNGDVLASWNYYTNITAENLEVMTNSSLLLSEFDKELAANATKMFDWTNFNSTNKRQFEKIVDIGFAATNDTEQLKRKNTLEAELTEIYSTGEVCLSDDRCLQLEPGLTNVITNSRNYNELLEVWKGWRDASGKNMRSKYTEFVDVMNKAIRFSNFNDTGEYWRSWYETPTFEEDVRSLFTELDPLYKELHAYVRKRLMQKYGKELFPTSGHIPAHLFGNMWAQQWSNIYDLLVPYPDAISVNITQKMIDKNYDVIKMYRVAEDFFSSIGMDNMTQEFWNNSMLIKPEGRDVVCHASAWDFYNGRDFR